jgi:hypothetical protein
MTLKKWILFLKYTTFTCLSISHIIQRWGIRWVNEAFLCPRDRRWEGHIVFVLSVILSPCHLRKTLTMAITFEWWVLGLWYFTRVFLVIRPFHGHQNSLWQSLSLGNKIFDLLTLTLVFNPLFEDFNLGYRSIFSLVGTKVLIFHRSVPFHGCQKIDLVTLVFDLLIKSFNRGYKVSTRALIFHMSIPCDKSFPWVFKIFDLVTLTFVFYLLIENFNFGFNFRIVSTRALIFHMNIPFDKTFPWVPMFLNLWPWPWCFTYLLKTLTMAIFFDW